MPSRTALKADRCAGSLVTQALGDALGFLVEGSGPEVCAGFAAEVFASHDPPSWGREPFSFGQYSDDTQLARELALTLAGQAGWSAERFAARVARLFETEAIVGRGRTTEAAARRLLAGVAWWEAGEPAPSAGNGAAMRAGPVGLRFADPTERLRVADEQARVTHRDPRARAAAVLVADVVADALGHDTAALAAVGTSAWCDRLAERVARLDAVLSAALSRLPEWLPLSVDEAAAAITASAASPGGPRHRFKAWDGISPFATPSALYAVYAFACSPHDAAQVLRRSIAVGGDVDTVAAMAGAMVGAAVGLSGLEPRLSSWATHLNDHGSFGFDDLVALAHRLV